MLFNILQRIILSLVICFTSCYLLPASALANISTVQPTEQDAMLYIEIFDIQLGRVVKQIPLTDETEQIAKNIVQAITKYSPQVSLNPKSGFAIKIPFEPYFTPNLSLFNWAVSELIIFLETDKEPWLLLFNQQNQPFVFIFEYDLQPFLDIIRFHPSTN